MDCNCINLAQIGVGAGIALLSLLAGAALVWKVADLVRWARAFTLTVVPRGAKKPRTAKEKQEGFSLGAKVVTVAALVLGGGAVAFILSQLA